MYLYLMYNHSRSAIADMHPHAKSVAHSHVERHMGSLFDGEFTGLVGDTGIEPVTPTMSM